MINFPFRTITRIHRLAPPILDNGLLSDRPEHPFSPNSASSGSRGKMGSPFERRYQMETTTKPRIHRKGVKKIHWGIVTSCLFSVATLASVALVRLWLLPKIAQRPQPVVCSHLQRASSSSQYWAFSRSSGSLLVSAISVIICRATGQSFGPIFTAKECLPPSKPAFAESRSHFSSSSKFLGSPARPDSPPAIP